MYVHVCYGGGLERVSGRVRGALCVNTLTLHGLLHIAVQLLSLYFEGAYKCDKLLRE